MIETLRHKNKNKQKKIKAKHGTKLSPIERDTEKSNQELWELKTKIKREYNFLVPILSIDISPENELF